MNTANFLRLIENLEEYIEVLHKFMTLKQRKINRNPVVRFKRWLKRVF